MTIMPAALAPLSPGSSAVVFGNGTTAAELAAVLAGLPAGTAVSDLAGLWYCNNACTGHEAPLDAESRFTAVLMVVTPQLASEAA